MSIAIKNPEIKHSQGGTPVTLTAGEILKLKGAEFEAATERFAKEMGIPKLSAEEYQMLANLKFIP